jgi:DNA end-binding protein Ku
MLELATHIVDTKRGKFEPEKFEDEYEDALKELLEKKQHGDKIDRPKETARSNVVDLMDALRKSISGTGGKAAKRSMLRPARRAAKAAPKRKKAS